jgi:predicted XRE-type DNA-binding protein
LPLPDIFIMVLKFYDSPFHVNHDEETASKMVMKMDLSIMLSRLIESKQWTQAQAAEQLGVKQSRISDLVNAKIEKFTIDALFDMLDKLGFQVCWSMPSLQKATVVIKTKATQ